MHTSRGCGFRYAHTQSVFFLGPAACQHGSCRSRVSKLQCCSVTPESPCTPEIQERRVRTPIVGQCFTTCVLVVHVVLPC